VRVLPALRHDISVTVHHEDGQDYLVLTDPFAVADGPILISADLLSTLERCDGLTTVETLAADMGVDVDGPQILQVLAFLGELDRLGYMEGEAYSARKAAAEQAFAASEIRPPVCAESTYPADPETFAEFMTDLVGPPADEDVTSTAPSAPYQTFPTILVPHLDFSAAPGLYTPLGDVLRRTVADVVVLVGTSHYGHDAAYVPTVKHFTTPYGMITTHGDVVQEVQQRLPQDVVATSDWLHRPEHSLELPLAIIHHIWRFRSFSVVPILAADIDISGAMSIIDDVLAERGLRPLYVISGDLAHVGLRFGHEEPAEALLDEVRRHDDDVLTLLREGDIAGFHARIAATENHFNVCGHYPLVNALGHRTSLPPGTVLSHAIWHDEPTGSAVSAAVVLWE